ncbi:hypothetical protein [Blautia sp.]|uniref:hypothetical protein n=1 Tax=Blautia sp. TaxID=1955243 RepID=UPI003AB3E578
MRKKSVGNAKFLVEIFSPKNSKFCETRSILDLRVNSYWDPAEILERGVKNFNDLQDLKTTLNWNLNGDSAKYQFQWGQSGKYGTTGYAYVFD